MAKPKSYHKCKECGYTTPKWVGQCPGCLEWNTMEEQVQIATKSTVGVSKTVSSTVATSLSAIDAKTEPLIGVIYCNSE